MSREDDGGPAGDPRWTRPVARGLLRVGWRAHVHDAVMVPRTGPLLLAANHLAFIDGPLVQAASPRPVHFLVKNDLFTGPLGVFLRAGGQIPVDRRGDRAALLSAVAVLRRGGVVGVFPEGTRGRGDLTSTRGGVTWLALQTGAPVVPVAVLGSRVTGDTRSGLPPLRRRMHVVFGHPVELAAPAGVPRREALRTVHETLRAVMDDHVRRAVARTGQPLPDDVERTSDPNGRGEHQ